jgi:hypothetical protein
MFYHSNHKNWKFPVGIAKIVWEVAGEWIKSKGLGEMLQTRKWMVKRRHCKQEIFDLRFKISRAD